MLNTFYAINVSSVDESIVMIPILTHLPHFDSVYCDDSKSIDFCIVCFFSAQKSICVPPAQSFGKSVLL